MQLKLYQKIFKKSSPSIIRLSEFMSIPVEKKEWVQQYDRLKNKGRRLSKKEANQYASFSGCNYFISIGKFPNKFNALCLYFYEKSKGFVKYYTFLDGEKNERQIMKWNDPDNVLDGNRAYKELQLKFSDLNRITFEDAFGTAFSSEFNHKKMFKSGLLDCDDFVACIPKQFYWQKSDTKNRLMTHISMVDFSSHYPGSIIGNVPTSKQSVRIKGRVLPNQDYPFAFYINTGTLAEFSDDGELLYDTHDFAFDPRFSSTLLEDDVIKRVKTINDSDEVTILMKKSKYNFNDTFKYFYDHRDEKPVNKLVMNASIGMFHQKQYKTRRYAHLAAVCLARANIKMLNLIQKIQSENMDVLTVIVDSITYKGSKQIGTSEKKLGEAHQEILDAIYQTRGINQYIFIKDGKVIKSAHASFNATNNGSDIDNPTQLSDMYHWINSDDNIVVTNLINQLMEEHNNVTKESDT